MKTNTATDVLHQCPVFCVSLQMHAQYVQIRNIGASTGGNPTHMLPRLEATYRKAGAVDTDMLHQTSDKAFQ